MRLIVRSGVSSAAGDTAEGNRRRGTEAATRGIEAPTAQRRLPITMAAGDRWHRKVDGAGMSLTRQAANLTAYAANKSTASMF